jgi:hypothetical protein
MAAVPDFSGMQHHDAARPAQTAQSPRAPAASLQTCLKGSIDVNSAPLYTTNVFSQTYPWCHAATSGLLRNTVTQQCQKCIVAVLTNCNSSS